MEEDKKKFFKVLGVLVVFLVIYFGVKTIYEIKKTSLLGEDSTPATISFSGHGEVEATPNIANIYFTISKDDKTVSAAQADVAAVEKDTLAVLTAKGVADADVQTTDASFNPKYEYQQVACPPNPVPVTTTGMSSPGIVCLPGRQVLVGYTASESITVKVRNIDTVGDIMQALGTTGVTNLSGPDFSIDNPDALQAQARKLAIDDAKSKAEVLAKDLGISLGKIESFSDDSVSPVMYSNAKVMSLGAVPASAPAVMPAGQNTITSDVTITYEIK